LRSSSAASQHWAEKPLTALWPFVHISRIQAMVDFGKERYCPLTANANSVSKGGSFENIDVASWALILVGALVRMVSYLFSANNGGDANAHAALAAKWLQQPTLKLVFDMYPPGHFWLIGLSALVVHDVVTAARLLSLVLGIASLFPVWKLASILYGTQAGQLSLGVFSWYSLHIAYSTTSSAEVSYLFFFLLAAYFFFRYAQRLDGLWRLIIAGVSLSLSESIRYEAWILFGGLFVILITLLWRRGSPGPSWSRSLMAAIAFGTSGGAWPVFMMAYSWYTFHDPMYLVSQNRLRVMSSLASGAVSRTHQLALAPAAVLLSLSLFAVVGAIYAIPKSFSLRLAGAFAGLTVFFATVQAYEIYSGGLLATARYTITMGTLLAVLSGYGLQKICERAAPRRMALAHGVVFSLLLVNSVVMLAASESPNRYAEKFASVSPRLRYPEDIQAVGDYLRSHLGPNDAVVIDGNNFESGILADSAGLPLLPGQRAYLATNKNTVDVRDYIQGQHPKFLVYAQQGALQRSLPLPEDCRESKIGGADLHCVFSHHIYRIYELSYP
jgi:4-amino-4-deoxy-L-arabinose transferase-like glycosyltransferase